MVYAYAKNRDKLYSKDVKTLYFSTLVNYNAVNFQLKFKTSYLNSQEVNKIIEYLAFILSLDSSKIQK